MALINLGRVGVVNKGNYIGGTTQYKILDVVKYDGGIYQCIQAHNTSHLPTDIAYWQLWVDPSGTGFDFVHTYNPAINTTAALNTTWFNTDTFEIFVCRDATLNANEWEGSEGTIISPAYIAAPTVTVTGEPSSVTLTPTITGTAYSIVGGSETHTDTDIEVRQGATLVYSVNKTTSLTSHTMPSGYLVAGTSYTFKMRYNSTTLTGTFGSKTATTSATPVVTADKAIFAYGFNGGYLSMSNLVSNTGIVGNDVTGVGTARGYLAAASYGA